MDAPSLTPERSRELADLQRRAYGRDAGVPLDHHSLQRLSELEAEARATTEVRVAEERNVGGQPTAAETTELTGEPITYSDVAAGEPARPDASPDPPPTRWWGRMPRWAPIVAAGVIGLLIGLLAAITPTERADTSLAGAADRTADLSTDWARSMMSWLDIDASLTEHESFGRFHVLSGTNRYGATCLMIVWDNIWVDGTCAPDGMTPIVDYAQSAGAAKPIEDDLPPGSVIRFELRGDRVDVTVQQAEERT